jgi:DNA-binding HxlR family transcriptional regulator
MPLRSDWSDALCPIARSLDTLGDPWALLIIRDVVSGTRRYDDLRTDLGIADSVLSARLRSLVEAGLLRRVPYSDDRRRREEYRLTEAGADVLPILQALARWGDRHRPAATPMLMVHLDCGSAVESADWCAPCGRSLVAQNVGWRRPADPDRLVRLAGADLEHIHG